MGWDLYVVYFFSLVNGDLCSGVKGFGFVVYYEFDRWNCGKIGSVVVAVYFGFYCKLVILE